MKSGATGAGQRRGRQREWSGLQGRLLEEHFLGLEESATRRKRLTRLVAVQMSAEPLTLIAEPV